MSTMKFYRDKECMRNYINDVIKQIKESKQEILFVRLVIDLQERWTTISELAVKKYINQLQVLDKNIKFDGEVLKYEQ